MYKVTWEIPNIPEQTGQGGLGSLCLDVDTPVALSPSRGGGELASGPTRPVHGAGETLPNRMPRHAPPWSSLCPALPWVEQGWARRQSHLGPGVGRCAPPDPMRSLRPYSDSSATPSLARTRPLPGSSTVPSLTAQEGSKWVSRPRPAGIIPGEGNGNPLQYSCLENFMDI